MKKTIMLTFVSLVGAFLFSTTAMAFDDLYTQDTSAVVKASGVDVGGKILYEFGKKVYDQDSKSADAAESATLIRVPLMARYGVMDKLEAFAILPIVSMSKMPNEIGGTLPDKSGIGDIWLGAKYAVMPEGCLTVRAALDLPTGSDKDHLGNPGGFGIDVAAMTAKKIDKLGLDGQIGVRFNTEGPEDAGKVTPGLAIYVNAEGSYNLMTGVDGFLGIEYAMAGDQKWNGTKEDKTSFSFLALNVGAKYMLMDKCGLRGDVFIPLAGKNTWTGSAGIIIALVIGVK